MTTVVTRIHLRLSNAYLIRGERAVLVDSGSPGKSQAILKALASAGVEASSLMSLLLHTLYVGHGGPLAMEAVRSRSQRLMDQLHK